MLAKNTYRTYKRNKLLNRLLLLTATAAGLHTLWDLVGATVVVALLDAGIVVWMLLLYFINKKGYRTLAGYGFLISASLIVLGYGSLVPRENGVNLLFLPLMSLVFVLFDYSQHWAKIGVSLFILSCYLLLELFDYRLLGDIQLLEEPDTISFVVNFITSGLFLYLSLSFITNANKNAEQHLQNLAEEVQQQNSLLTKTNEELDRFVYSTSHDLRAPLLSVLGLVQLMERNGPMEPLHDYLGMMRNRINNLVDFINDITTYSRNARLPLQPEPHNIAALVQEVFNSHTPVDDHKLELRQEGDEQLMLMLDRQRLLTILKNLVSNAIKYHRLQDSHPYVSVGYELQQGALHLWVADNGPGIAPEVQQRMFEMFYRGDERSGGSGLGLYIVKEAVEKLKGRITATSIPGQGSTFHVWVPGATEGTVQTPLPAGKS